MAGLAQPAPRATSSDATLSDIARFWLQMHDGFRRETDHMAQASELVLGSSLEARAYHDRVLPVLAGFLQHLNGHHHVETGHYFPQFRRLDPARIAALDLLDRDHDAVHAHLEALAATGNALHRAVRGGAGSSRDDALALADAVLAARAPLTRHLDDEEDIVIPVLTRADIR